MGKGPNCYKCVHRGDNPGSAHSTCRHPAFGQSLDSPMGEAMAIFASVGRANPVKGGSSDEKIIVEGRPHGIKNGWFNHPWDFDPTWLDKCTGFKEKE